MSDKAHRGAVAPGPMVHGGDRRITEIADVLQLVEIGSLVAGVVGFMRDPLRGARVKKDHLATPGNFDRAVIIHSIPYLNWYKIQVGRRSAMACKLDQAGLVPIGPRETGPYPPNSSVLVYQPPGLNYYVILGAIPPALEDGSIINPDWLLQGGGSGLKREKAHQFPIKDTQRGGGVIDWSANRPLDETTFTKGWITPTGLAMLIDDFAIQVRVNEMCGLFLSIYDSWCRLAGMQLHIESSVHEQSSGDDEGECRHFNGVAMYPWEALGIYASGTTFTKVNDDKEIQYTKHEGKIDLKDQKTAPIYRYQEFGGYLGQGRLRTVMAPGRESGTNTFEPGEADECLFREMIAATGALSVISAKSVHIGKRCKIVQPREIRLPEDGQGDDAVANNYKASSMFGSGAEHHIKDIRFEGESKSLLKAAAVNDVIAYTVNWPALHPFHYHQGDYKTWQESETGKFESINDGNLDFGSLEDQNYLDDPIGKMLHIDHRYGDVEYFERESFLMLHDDGSVQLGCGFGNNFVLGPLGISIESPAAVRILAGTDAIVMADQVCMTAKKSMDLVADKQDMRIKAKKNMQILVNDGGLLVETRGGDGEYAYRRKFGEDVKSSGIVFRADKSTCAFLGQDLYFRTGGALGNGDIVFDAAKGNNNVYFYAQAVTTFTTEAVQFCFGPINETSKVTQVYSFATNTCTMAVQLLVKDKIIGYGESAGIVVNGSVYGTGSFAAGGTMADSKGRFLETTPSGFTNSLNTYFSKIPQQVQSLQDDGTSAHKQTYVQGFYEQDKLGNDESLKNMHFSYRDPPGAGRQYHTNNFKFPEPRWQQMLRFGMATGNATNWEVDVVDYQGEKTCPWPGKRLWKDDPKFLRLESLTMFDASLGYDRDRPGPYEDPHVADFSAVTLEQGLKTNRQ